MKKICFLMAIVLILAISACISLPSEKMTIKTGTLTVGVFKHAPPAVYEQNGKLIGFEVELVSEIAKRMNLNVEFKEYMFSNLLNAVANNKVDCAISDISISPEREKIVSFTRAYSIL
ncbi:transporter substrate-binding domain-containing protein [Methanococcus maripaludis]|uniref:Polar amino acid transport system substrate-binding protein n=1 Tax=Methanococcus maripaludis TaxID=39152 RepID=A0A7J9PNV4_METMI|nr:transporter substrate-binding domain-containing protein [Methanococcus maripaludis]MBA2864454.1 polar amino acid transport system substrate-binding protein [Methanococcus maripaludis]